MSLREEIQEFVDEVSGKLHPDEKWTKQAHHIVREGFDVIGLVLEAGANPEDLKSEVIEAVNKLLPKMNLGAVVKRFAPAVISFVVPDLIDQAVPYIGKTQDFINEQVLPRLDEWIETLADVRGDLTQDIVG